MANQVTNYKCPACTGPLRFDSATGKLQCDFCGSSYEVAEIEKLVAAVVCCGHGDGFAYTFGDRGAYDVVMGSIRNY